MGKVCVLFALAREAKAFLRAQLRDVEIHITGVGAEATLKTLHALDPECVISAGFCGSLVETLHIGDLVPRSQIVSVREPILSVRQRQELHKHTGALAVDMETATVEQWCQQRGVKFHSVRVVSDDLRYPLPAELPSIVEGERLKAIALLGCLLRRPGLGRDLLRLARDTRRASEILAKALRQQIQQAVNSSSRGGPSS
jgi:purine-nucleoside phosphorylase